MMILYSGAASDDWAVDGWIASCDSVSIASVSIASASIAIVPVVLTIFSFVTVLSSDTISVFAQPINKKMFHIQI